MGKVNIQKQGKVFQYQFEIASVNGERKFINKSGFRTRSEAEKEGAKAYTEYLETGRSFKPSEVSYSDYLDYWIKEYCQVNLKYNTLEGYKRIIRIYIKPKLGCYPLKKQKIFIYLVWIKQKICNGSL